MKALPVSWNSYNRGCNGKAFGRDFRIFGQLARRESAALQKMDYYPYGLQWENRNQNFSNNAYGHTSKEMQDNEWQDKGLDWEDFGARMYDPVIGRWWSVDPLAEARRQWAPYNYCSDNPVNRIDPTGALDGDYYTYEGTYLGSDGKNDDKTYVVEGGSKFDIKDFEIGGKYHDNHLKFNEDMGDGYSVTDIGMNHSEFQALAGTLYAEGSNTWEEAAGIYSVMENRAAVKDRSTYEIAKGGGIYGWSERDKINSPAARSTNVQNAYKGLIAGIRTDVDYSNGAFYWHGRDFGLSSWAANRDFYRVGFEFTNPSHDLWNQGSIKSGNTLWDYKFQSTGAAGKTTFMKLTEKWIKAQNYKGKW